jgi:hypothetical protein
VTLKASDKADAQKIGEALNTLAGAEGELTPSMVVEAAKSPRHILHKHFEWDDTIAAGLYRIDQARAVIRSICVEDADTDEGRAPAYISISDKGGTSYRTLSAVKGSADLQAKVLAQAERDLEAWEKRYRSLSDVCAIVRTAREKIRQKRSKEDSRAQA